MADQIQEPPALDTQTAPDSAPAAISAPAPLVVHVPDPSEPTAATDTNGDDRLSSGTPIAAMGAGDDKDDPGYAPRFNLREAVEKIKAQEDANGEGGKEPAAQRGADGKFLSKEGAKKPASISGDYAAAAAKPDAAASNDTPPTIDELEKQIPSMGNKDKKRYTAWAASYKAVQAEAAAAKQRAAELETKTRELESKATAAPSVPKEIEDELTALRGRSRAWEITTDPSFIREHDTPIANNLSRIEQALTDSWRSLGISDNKIKPQLEIYRKVGFDWNVMAEELAGLRESKKVGDAVRIESLLRKNEDLSQARAEAIGHQTQQNAIGSAQRAEQTKAQQAAQQRMQEIALKSTNDGFTATESEIKKLLPSLVAPDAPSDKDSPAVAQSKRAAQAEYAKAISSVRDEFARFAPDPTDPDKTAKLTGEFQSLVLLGLLAKSHLLPRAAKELSARDAAIAERDNRISAFRKGGAVNGAHLAAAQSDSGTRSKVTAAIENPNRAPGDVLRAAYEEITARQNRGIV